MQTEWRIGDMEGAGVEGVARDDEAAVANTAPVRVTRAWRRVTGFDIVKNGAGPSVRPQARSG